MRAIFIGGTGRSGTTILKKVLSQHHQVVSMPFELRLIVDPGGVLDLINNLSENWSPYNADLAIYNFFKLAKACSSSSSPSTYLARLLIVFGISPWRYYQIGIGQVIGVGFYNNRLKRLFNELVHNYSNGSWTGSPPFRIPSKIYEAGPFDYHQVAEILARFIEDLYTPISKGAQEKTCWVEDTPFNLLHARELLRVFPEMKLLHIYRDPRDVLASYRTKYWGGNEPSVIAHRLNGILSRWFEINHFLPKDSYLEIPLEHLAIKPKDNLEKICRFVGLEYDPSLEKVKLDRVNSGRWKKDLSTKDLQNALPILKPIIERLNYN